MAINRRRLRRDRTVFTQYSDLLTVTEAADLLGMHKVTIEKLARTGELPAKKFGAQWRISKQKLMEYMGVTP